MREGWEIKKLGEVCDFQNGFAFKSNTYKENGLPILRITNIQNQSLEINDLVYFDKKDYKENFDKFKVIKDDLVIAMSGATTGKLGINKTETVFYLNQRVGKFIPKKDILKPFLYYFLSTKVEESLRIAAGAAQPNLSTEQINSFEIPVPPLAEQQRIVTILAEAFDAIAKAKANTEQNLKNAKGLFESYLQGVFGNKGDGWEETSLNTEIDLLTGFAFKSNLYSEFNEDILLIRGDNIMQGDFRWNDAKRWRKDEYQTYQKYQLKENDVVLAMDRPWVKAGLKCAMVSKNLLPALLVQRTACLRCKENIDHSFLFLLIKSKAFVNYLLNVQTGIGVPHISGQQILNFNFSMPKLVGQQTIVQKLDALSVETKKLEAIYQKKLEDLEELKKSILQKAFSGELTEKEVLV